jgi:hypothetical protein
MMQSGGAISGRRGYGWSWLMCSDQPACCLMCRQALLKQQVIVEK